MTVYRLEQPIVGRVVMFLVLTLFTAGVLILIGNAVVTPSAEALLPVLFLGPMVSFWWYMVITVPYRIELHSVDDIRFVALRRTIRTSAIQIQSLKLGNPAYVLRHSGGKMPLMPQFTGLYQLLAAIKEANPAFETRGI